MTQIIDNSGPGSFRTKSEHKIGSPHDSTTTLPLAPTINKDLEKLRVAIEALAKNTDNMGYRETKREAFALAHKLVEIKTNEGEVGQNLVSTLLTCSTSPAVREGCAYALRIKAIPETLPALSKAIDDHSPMVALAAFRALRDNLLTLNTANPNNPNVKSVINKLREKVEPLKFTEAMNLNNWGN